MPLHKLNSDSKGGDLYQDILWELQLSFSQILHQIEESCKDDQSISKKDSLHWIEKIWYRIFPPK